ncbi:hypothetical protein PsorP6_001838 [Peronosclerospora sorghi]|uniref:Uncharacterized protein n=1 Tax=Peronosclerospora sorghi TaxID=230839 RepID=A0ACC0WV63_9STRA|nr:hypothetical protein PsorP6_001838 [Peronosclerospora sorghi]
MVQYFTYKQAEEEEVTDKVYFDHISEGDNKQDRESVGLKAHSMVPNRIVDTVEHNRERISGLAKQVEAMERQLKQTTDEEGEDEVETAWLTKEGCEDQEDDGAEGQSDDNDDKMEEMSTENLDPQASTGRVTGIQITKQFQIRRRQRWWRNKPRTLPEQHTTLVEALQLHSTGEIVVTDRRDDIQRNQRGLSDIDEGFQIPFDFPSKLVVRPRRGEMYGHKYICAFREEISEIFFLGQQENSAKKGPGPSEQQPQHLFVHPQLQHPHPQAQQNSIWYSERRPAAGSSLPRARGRGRKSTMLIEHMQLLVDLLASSPEIMPRAALEVFKYKFVSSDVSDQQVKNKVSALKAALKNHPSGHNT